MNTNNTKAIAEPESCEKRRRSHTKARSSSFTMITTHVLKMKCGITCTMRFDEQTAHYDCEWSRWPISTLRRYIILSSPSGEKKHLWADRHLVVVLRA